MQSATRTVLHCAFPLKSGAEVVVPYQDLWSHPVYLYYLLSRMLATTNDHFSTFANLVDKKGDITVGLFSY